MSEHVGELSGLDRGDVAAAGRAGCPRPCRAAFPRRSDGFSIGSNDLTPLVLGPGRDAEALSHLFDERSPAVVAMIRQLIGSARESGTPVGLCGQAPSDHPDFAELLVEAGITTISVNPDSVLDVLGHVAAAEARLARG